MERRDFLKAAAASVAVATGAATAEAQAPSSSPVKRPQSPDMIYRQLGTTGESVSAIGMGGFHIGKQEDPKDSIKLIHAAMDGGITFMDNCWDYNDGISEVRMGEALRNGRRDKVFLMTKIDGRTSNALFTLPFKGSRWKEGYSLTAIETMHSGTPFSAYDGIDRLTSVRRMLLQTRNVPTSFPAAAPIRSGSAS